MSAHWIKKEHWLPDEMKQGWNWSLKKELMFGNPNKPLSLVFEIFHQVHVYIYTLLQVQIFHSKCLTRDLLPITVKCRDCKSNLMKYCLLVCVLGQKHYVGGIHVCTEQQHVEDNR